LRHILEHKCKTYFSALGNRCRVFLSELTYDDNGKITTVVAPDHSESFVYDDKNVLTSKTVDATTYEFTYKATADKALDSISVDGNTVKPNTDALGRNTGKTIEIGENKIAEEKISYVKFGDHATSLPSNVRFATNGVFNESIQYRYDSMGNIVEIFENGRSVCRYEYDTLGRLTREDNVAFGKTTTWAYDNNGNIIARYEYAITTKPTSELHLMSGTCKLYTYADNSDQLMSYNGDK
jgi:YD repeat-containing protein